MSSPDAAETPAPAPEPSDAAAETPESSSKENQPTDNNAPAAASASAAETATDTTAKPTAAAPAAAATSGLPSAVEFEPPVACVRRILKNTLHSHTNVAKDSVTAFARASGIFIIYLTACANDFARENRRQTITAADVLAAIKASLKYDESGMAA